MSWYRIYAYDNYKKRERKYQYVAKSLHKSSEHIFPQSRWRFQNGSNITGIFGILSNTSVFVLFLVPMYMRPSV